MLFPSLSSRNESNSAPELILKGQRGRRRRGRRCLHNNPFILPLAAAAWAWRGQYPSPSPCGRVIECPPSAAVHRTKDGYGNHEFNKELLRIYTILSFSLFLSLTSSVGWTTPAACCSTPAAAPVGRGGNVSSATFISHFYYIPENGK